MTTPAPRKRTPGRVVDVNVINGDDVEIPGAGDVADVPEEDEAEEEAPAPIIPEWMVASFVEGSFKLAAESRGPHWLIDDEQLASIAEPLSGELDDLVREIPFLRDASGRISERRLRLVAATGGIVGIRLLKDYNLARQRAKAAAEAKRRSGQGDRVPTPIRADLARSDPPPTGETYTPGDIDHQPPPPSSLGSATGYEGGATYADMLAGRTPPSA